MLKINRENLKSSHQLIWFIIDFLMLGLLVINLVLIIWDSVYNFVAIQNLLKEHLPAFQAAYNPIHENFILYDAMFVAVFLTEFFVRWGYAIRAKVYDRWYFYPFIHWYDVIGCIPVGSLRFLRILRVISIVYRLHQYKIIDVTGTGLYRFVNFYYEAFMEELSDRIVAKVLSGVQHEIKLGSPLFALRSYLEDRVDHALKQNVELSRLKYLPVVGSTIQETLEDAVGDIVANVIQQILEDLASSSNHAFIEDIVNAFIRGPGEPDTDEERNDALIALIIEIIDAIKGQVKVKRWREQLP